jgi:hypothetical protein
MKISALCWSLLCGAVLSRSAFGRGSARFRTLEARKESLPTIKLPYGTWQAYSYDAVNDVMLLGTIASFSDVNVNTFATLDLLFQEHSLRRASSRKFKIRETGTANTKRHTSDGDIRSLMRSKQCQAVLARRSRSKA